MKKVLVINDSRFESAILKDLLIRLGYDVKTTSEYYAIQEINNYLPNLVISNLVMKETSGDLLIKRIKDIQKDVTCFLSSCSDLNIEDYKYNKVDGVIKTPVNLEDLNNILKGTSSKHDKEKFTFCPYCGGKFGEEPYSFCPYCGERINKIAIRV